LTLTATTALLSFKPSTRQSNFWRLLTSDKPLRALTMNPFTKPHQDYYRYTCLRGCIFVLEGLIGVGKSTLGKSLETTLNDVGVSATFLAEFVSSDLLEQYISDMGKYAYTFQMIMLCKRLEIYREAQRRAKQGEVVFVDRSLVGDYVFALLHSRCGNLSEEEFQIYQAMLHSEKPIEPTTTLFLQADVPTCISRAAKRGRKSEDAYDTKYFEALSSTYDEVFAQMSPPCTTVDWSTRRPDREVLDLLRATITK
jgi:deoxyadenosine/deoxycytidine kinase